MPFTNPIIAGTKLVRTAINSPDYVAGVSGWAIKRDGTAEFSDVTARGTVEAGSVSRPVILNDDGITVGDSPGIAITMAIPAELVAHYAAEALTIDTATLSYTTNPDIYWYEAAAGLVQVRGYVHLGAVVETTRNAWGTPVPLPYRQSIDVSATSPQTPASTTPLLMAGTQTSIVPNDYGPNGVSWECIYTGDIEQVSGSNTTTAVELFLDGVSGGYRQILFNPGNTSVTTPAHRLSGLTQIATGYLAASSVATFFGLYTYRALGTGTNRVNSLHTGYTLKLYY